MDRKQIIAICGACISFYIGAGFATMQEVIQYEASYGSLFPITILVAGIIYLYTNISFAKNGNEQKLERGGDIYEVYCGVFGEKFGKFASKFFDYFAALFCYMSFVVMCGGANSTFSQQWGLPNGMGAIILTVSVIFTVLLGLEGIVKSLSKMGTIIIVMILGVSIITAITGNQMFQANMAAIDAGVFSEKVKQVGNGSPIMSGASYGGFVILWFASFLSEIGCKNKLKAVNLGVILSSGFIFGTSTICCIALISYFGNVAGVDVPALVLANQISPWVSQLFAIVICIGIYTSAVPLLWTGVRKFTPEGNKKYGLLTCVGGILGCIIACFIPYQGLINILYGINGYLGAILMLFMILYDVKNKLKKKGDRNESTVNQ